MVDRGQESDPAGERVADPAPGPDPSPPITEGRPGGDGPTEVREQSVGTAASRGFLWANVGVATRYISALVLAAVLARVLGVTDYAVMVTLMVVTYYFDNALDLGMGAALVYEQEKGITPRVQVAFTATLGVTLILSTGAFLLAPVIVAYFKLPGYENVFRCLPLVVIMSGCTAIPWSLFVRSMDFRSRAIVELVRDLTRFGLTLGLALAGLGAWAVMIGMLGAYFAWMTLTWYFMRFRPNLTWNTKVAKELFSYAWRMAGSRLLGVLSLNGDYVVVGNRRPDQYPQYYQAFRLPEFVLGAQLNAMSAVLFPMYSRIRSEGRMPMREALYKALRLVALFSLPAGIGLALVARDAISVMYGLDGHAADVATRTMEVLSIAGCFAGLGFATGDLLFAIGRPGIMVRLNAVMVPVMLAAMWIVAPHGIVWVAAVHLVVAAVFTIVRQLVVNHVVDAGIVPVTAALVPGAIVAACILGFGLPVRLLTSTGLVSMLLILLAGSVGALLGLGLSRSARAEVTDLIVKLRG